MTSREMSLFFFFFNDTATTEIYTLSLHDALPICYAEPPHVFRNLGGGKFVEATQSLGTALASPKVGRGAADRKSTRLNSSHQIISYAVFCLKKKKGADRARTRITRCTPPLYGSRD